MIKFVRNFEIFIKDLTKEHKFKSTPEYDKMFRYLRYYYHTYISQKNKNLRHVKLQLPIICGKQSKIKKPK